MTPLFSVTLFLSALLLFSVQPMMGKMLLPVFGGAPAVWQTALVFFQAMLLGGYAYAHLTSRWMGPRSRVILHFLLLLAAGAFLPLSLDRLTITPTLTTTHQAWHLLVTLFQVVGLPFFILSSTSPLLQLWFSTTGHATARDPYYLSVASNFGSLVALLAFPLCVEPFLTLRSASLGWQIVYALLIPLILSCAARSGQWRRSALTPTKTRTGSPSVVGWRRRLRWIAFAAVPSSLMLGLTTFITTEVASIPLLGILPLALYLATFILAFAKRRLIPVRWLGHLLPYAALCLAFQIFTEATHPIAVIVVLHLIFFFLAALLCHSRLADDRPSSDSLTEFYLWMSVGGVLGGFFNALLAPVLFRVVVEYPLAIVLSCLFRHDRSINVGRPKDRRLDLLIPLGVGLAMVGLIAWVEHVGWLEPYPRRVVLFGAGAVLSFLSIDRAVRFGLSLGMVFLSTATLDSLHGRTLDIERNFFGVSRVTLDPDGRSHRLVHGNTIHGRQNVKPTMSCEPLTYFHRAGPLGRIFRIHEDAAPTNRVAITGLGCGAIAGYARAGELWDYYEIDPAVIRIASDTNLFTFLRGCAPVPVRVIEGDARLRLLEAEDSGYGLIIMDAFTSDSIPLHLLTREALALYLRKLAPGGLLAMNISNRYLDLAPVVGALASDAGLAGYHWEDPFEEKEVGKEPSHWAVLAREASTVLRFSKDSRWRPLSEVPATRVWTDDYSNVLGAMKWSQGSE